MKTEISDFDERQLKENKAAVESAFNCAQGLVNEMESKLYEMRAQVRWIDTDINRYVAHVSSISGSLIGLAKQISVVCDVLPSRALQVKLSVERTSD